MWQHLCRAIVLSLLVSTHGSPTPKGNSTGKLLYILLDGFRYDYVDDLPADELPGFNEFLNNGVKAKWVNPLHPTLSYPSWTTLVTGLYAESHNIVGNYFYDAKDKDEFMLFDNDATGKSKWWTAEPLWTTATKAGLRTAVYLWARCDIPIDEVVPEICEKFEKITGPEIFKTNIDKALKRFEEGYDLVQVYTEHLDNIGHNIGPETEERKTATKEIDVTMVYLQEKLKSMQLDDTVNVVIVSDHGMAPTPPDEVKRLEMDDYLPKTASVENIADYGAYANIKVLPGHLDEVYESLSKMDGVSVYKREDIPEEWHLTNSEYIHDILLQADINRFILASNSSAQLPPRSSYVYQGAHGYSPDEQKMKSIFFAKGPAFKKDMTLDPIDIVDIYQALTKALNIEPRPNNGTFENVRGAFVDAAAGPLAAGIVLPLVAVVTMFNKWQVSC